MCFDSSTLTWPWTPTHTRAQTQLFQEIEYRLIQSHCIVSVCVRVCVRVSGLCQKASSVVKTFPCVMHLSNTLIWHRLCRVFISGFLGNHIYYVFSEQPLPKKKNNKKRHNISCVKEQFFQRRTASYNRSYRPENDKILACIKSILWSYCSCILSCSSVFIYSSNTKWILVCSVQ